MDDILTKVNEYKKDYAVLGRAHYLAADNLSRYNHILGIPVVVITVIVGSTIFGTITKNPDIEWKIAAGLVSLLAAVLSSLQTSLKFTENSEKHKSAGAKYRAISRKFDLFILKYGMDIEEKRQEAIIVLEKLIDELSELASESPNVPDKFYYQAEKEY